MRRESVRSLGIAIVVTVGVVAAILLAIALDDGGADLSYKTLDYDVQVQSNGDLKITQHIDMKLADAAMTTATIRGSSCTSSTR